MRLPALGSCQQPADLLRDDAAEPFVVRGVEVGAGGVARPDVGAGVDPRAGARVRDRRIVSRAPTPKRRFRSLVPSMTTTRSMGSCVMRQGARSSLPLRNGPRGSSQTVVLPFRPS